MKALGEKDQVRAFNAELRRLRGSDIKRCQNSFVPPRRETIQRYAVVASDLPDTGEEDLGALDLDFILDVETHTDDYEIVDVEPTASTFLYVDEANRLRSGPISDPEAEQCMASAYRGSRLHVRGVEPGQRLRFASGHRLVYRYPRPTRIRE